MSPSLVVLVRDAEARREVRPMSLEEALAVWPSVGQALGLCAQRRPRRWWPRRPAPRPSLPATPLPVRFFVDVEPVEDDVVMLTPYCVVEEP